MHWRTCRRPCTALLLTGICAIWRGRCGRAWLACARALGTVRCMADGAHVLRLGAYMSSLLQASTVIIIFCADHSLSHSIVEGPARRTTPMFPRGVVLLTPHTLCNTLWGCCICCIDTWATGYLHTVAAMLIQSTHAQLSSSNVLYTCREFDQHGYFIIPHSIVCLLDASFLYNGVFLLCNIKNHGLFPHLLRTHCRLKWLLLLEVRLQLNKSLRRYG